MQINGIRTKLLCTWTIIGVVQVVQPLHVFKLIFANIHIWVLQNRIHIVDGLVLLIHPSIILVSLIGLVLGFEDRVQVVVRLVVKVSVS